MVAACAAAVVVEVDMEISRSVRLKVLRAHRVIPAGARRRVEPGPRGRKYQDRPLDLGPGYFASRNSGMTPTLGARLGVQPPALGKELVERAEVRLCARHQRVGISCARRHGP